ncbi:MAG: Serine/threonine-protein kinase pkn1 [Myxococcota bacterium]|nr:Serine/threonine-protein kinase pkn1 [Myxococcota bacterium]
MTGEVQSIALPGCVSIEMVWIAPGAFMMGSPSTEEGREDDETQHLVTLTKGFWLGKHQVTQAQWRAVMGGDPSHFLGDTVPVESVSWDDCQRFVARMNQIIPGGGFRLPTEAEWEYACRAGTAGAYAGAGDLDEMGWYGDNSGRETHPVGQKQPNAWGLYDMHGNVWEWCEDSYSKYPSGPVIDPLNKSGSNRLGRGGGWNDYARSCRSAFRYSFSPDLRFSGMGFRLARTW